jgi:hypothetical protein
LKEAILNHTSLSICCLTSKDGDEIEDLGELEKYDFRYFVVQYFF